MLYTPKIFYENNILNLFIIIQNSGSYNNSTLVNEEKLTIKRKHLTIVIVVKLKFKYCIKAEETVFQVS